MITYLQKKRMPIPRSDLLEDNRALLAAPGFLDRVIVAQAARRNLTIATSDTRIIRAALTSTLKI
jgi:PIN domain nuclease of toxin-antitoxin system